MRVYWAYMIVALAFVLGGCEVIPEAERLVPVDTPAGGGRRHMLVEYTGFRCVNCPSAAETAEQLQSLYGDELIVVSMHPASNPFTQGLYDYTCPMADSLYLWMGGTASTPFPTGNIDLQAADDGYLIDPLEWPGQLLQAMQDTAAPYLEVSAYGDSLTGELKIEVAMGATAAMDCRLAVWLTEDSVHGVQAMPDGSVNSDYIHRHMLRAAITPERFGIPCSLSTSVSMQILDGRCPDECVADQCHIVALLLDKDDYHLLQAYETTITYISDPLAMPQR